MVLKVMDQVLVGIYKMNSENPRHYILKVLKENYRFTNLQVLIHARLTEV